MRAMQMQAQSTSKNFAEMALFLSLVCLHSAHTFCA